MLGRSGGEKKSQEDISYTRQAKTQHKLDVKRGTMEVGWEVLPPAKQKWSMGDYLSETKSNILLKYFMIMYWCFNMRIKSTSALRYVNLLYTSKTSHML
jgi:hypothetical protein